MRNNYQSLTTLLIAVLLIACSNKRETPESIAAEWCALNSKVSGATGTEKEKALEARKNFEKMMEAKYQKDTAVMQAIFKAVKACEAASEGKNAHVTAVAPDPGAESLLPAAYSDATAAADAYCSLIDQSIAAAKNSSDAELNNIVAAKILFEKNMEESYKDNADRRDSIFERIKPCMEKEVAFRSR
ncbi:hypothetical protein LL912_18745 [Niabella sp. CC-SYL272]|uniref:hypothetical protein n=1 Tax=Niabella agricola TaxID=2891571 RepID=UPI001F1FFF2C|nr:hypothetical protein [Niabella agricola]MCF3110830.1 hypothetical protein [Niabella agricola]